MSKLGQISINELTTWIQDQLEDYEYVAKTVVDKAIDRAAEEGAEQLRSTSPKRTGEYAASWTTGYKRRGKNLYSKAIYADAPHYRLTHLLEKGHAKVNGGRVAPIRHIQPAESFTIQKLIEFIKEGLE